MSRALGDSKTGKPLDRPGESELYDRNACPPVAYLKGLPWDFIDASGHKYWEIARHERLIEWVEKSRMQALFSADMDNDRDTGDMVRQSAQSRKDK